MANIKDQAGSAWDRIGIKENLNLGMEPANQLGLMTVEAVQRSLNRSRASIYRYANTEPEQVNPPYDPQKLNPELRSHKEEPLVFHPNEVARFAKDVLKISQVTIEVQAPTETLTQDLLRAILSELKDIHQLLRDRES